MATLQRALNYELKNTGSISALVGARIYPDGDVPGGTASPYITTLRISRVRHRHQAGGPNITTVRYQINAIARSSKVSAATAPEIAVSAVVEAVTAAMDRFRGAMGEAGSTVTVRGMYHENDRDVPIDPSDGSQRGSFETQMDFIIHYVEA